MAKGVGPKFRAGEIPLNPKTRYPIYNRIMI
jgi:hypothetical protein